MWCEGWGGEQGGEMGGRKVNCLGASIPKAVSSEELAIGGEKRPCTIFVFCLFVKVCAIVLLLCKY